MIQVYGSFVISIGVHTNHYFLLIPLFATVGIIYPDLLWVYLLVSLVFAAQDFIFFGIGRDWNYMTDALSERSLGWLSVVLSVVNCLIFTGLSFYVFSLGMFAIGG